MMRRNLNRFKTVALLAVMLLVTRGPAWAADSWFDWVGGVGDYFDPNNWSDIDAGGGPGMPNTSDAVWINNGGTANAVGAGGSRGQFRVYVGIADVGRTIDDGLPGTGTVNFTNLSLSVANGPLQVGSNNGEVRSVNGTLTVTNGSIELSYPVPRFDIGVASGDLDGHTATGRVSADGSVSGAPKDSMVLRIGEYNGAGASADAHADGALTVGTGLRYWQTTHVGVYHNPGAGGSGSATGALTISAGGISGTNIGPATLTVGSATGANGTATATADITGDFLPDFNANFDFGALNIGLADGDATTRVNAAVTLRGSHADIDTVTVGKRVNGTENVTASLALNPSLLDTDLLDLGDAGTLTFHLEGLTRVTAATVGNAGTYAAADAVDAMLAGRIVADFDFTPPAGAHVFDLIVTDSDTALDDATMTPADFQVVGLNPGFTVDAFGVVEDRTDIVRLQISGVPVAAVPEPGSAALLAIGGLGVLTRRRRRA